jgi:hypothetical protein
MAFQDAVVDYAIPPAESVQLLQHVLRDRAYQYYHSHVLTQANCDLRGVPTNGRSVLPKTVLRTKF